MNWFKKKTKVEQIHDYDLLVEDIIHFVEERHPGMPAIQKGLTTKLIFLGMIIQPL